ncbi:MAG: GTP 3',8-cyclase MoaA [bacterium]|jgi:cyclic pyranopterin phosphate synthase
MSQPLLYDRLGRQVTYLRMSVTDRCNFRCTYCMPAEGLRVLGRYDLLTYEELARIGKVFVEQGIQKIRLTGGEPLLRKDLSILVRKLVELEGLKELCLTTNGHLLEECVVELVESGVKRINVSIDSLKPEKFTRITRGGNLDRVLRGVEKAHQVLSSPIKINVVASKNFNDDEVLDFARLTVENGYTVRFIEPMPMSAQASWERGEVLSVIEIRQQIAEYYGLEPVEQETRLSGPAERFRIPGARGELGFIGAVTKEFCARCNRIRLTPDGKLRGCLMADGEVDFLKAMRDGASDEEMTRLLLQVMRTKPERHYINEELHFIRPLRTMSQIGG